MSKLPIPTGPSEIFRRMQPVSEGQTAKTAARPRNSKSVAAPFALTGPDSPQPLTRMPATKAQKVKAWRKANPEAYAEQKRRSVEKRAANNKPK